MKAEEEHMINVQATTERQTALRGAWYFCFHDTVTVLAGDMRTLEAFHFKC